MLVEGVPRRAGTTRRNPSLFKAQEEEEEDFKEDEFKLYIFRVLSLSLSLSLSYSLSGRYCKRVCVCVFRMPWTSLDGALSRSGSAELDIAKSSLC
jgi:hypothetical protein